jgi:hypothetical protein
MLCDMGTNVLTWNVAGTRSYWGTSSERRPRGKGETIDHPNDKYHVTPCISHIFPRTDLIYTDKMATASDNQQISEGEPSDVIQSAWELEATPSLPSVDSDELVSCRVEI